MSGAAFESVAFFAIFIRVQFIKSPWSICPVSDFTSIFKGMQYIVVDNSHLDTNTTVEMRMVTYPKGGLVSASLRELTGVIPKGGAFRCERLAQT